MNWRGVARKNVHDAIRSKAIWLLIGLFLTTYLGGTVAIWQYTEASFTNFVTYSTPIVAAVLPLISLALGYKSIVEDRTSGRIALLLSLPYSRRDLLVGTFIGRALVLQVPVLLGYAVAGAFIIAMYDSFSAGAFLGYLGITVLYGLAFLSVAIALSVSTRSPRQVTLGAVGLYAVFHLFWGGLVMAATWVVYRFNLDALATPPWWSVLLELSSPSQTFTELVAAVVDVGAESTFGAADAPWFAEPWFGLVVLLAWIGLPLTAGYLRFRNADL